MNLDPLTMESVLYQGSHNANVGAHGRERNLILIIGARSHSVRRLTDVEPAYDFEHQIAAFMVRVSGVQEILKFGIHLEPPVSVSVILVAHSIGLSPGRRIHNLPGYRSALLMHDQTVRVVDVIPQSVITGTRRRGRRRSWRRWWNGRSWRNADKLRPDPTNQIVLSPNMIETTVRGRVNQSQPGTLGEMVEHGARGRGVAAKNDIPSRGCLLRPQSARASKQEEQPDRGSPENDLHGVLRTQEAK